MLGVFVCLCVCPIGWRIIMNEKRWVASCFAYFMCHICAVGICTRVCVFVCKNDLCVRTIIINIIITSSSNSSIILSNPLSERKRREHTPHVFRVFACVWKPSP